MTDVEDGTRTSVDSLRAIWAAGPAEAAAEAARPWYRRVTRRQIGVAVGCLAVLAGVVVAVESVDSGMVRRDVALPSAFGSLVPVQDDEDLAQLRREYEADTRRRFAPGTVGVVGYGAPGSTGVDGTQLLVAAWTGSFADAAQTATKVLGGYRPTGVGHLSDGTLVTGMDTFDPGPLGGAIACATLGVPGQGVPACAWADGSTAGFLIDFDADASVAKLADRTREFRSLAEHEK